MKLRYSIIALLCIGAAVWMLVLLQHNVVFFKPVSTAVHDRSHDGRHTLRIGGGVVPDSIVEELDAAGPDAADLGVRLTIDIVQRLRAIEGIAGVHVMGLGREESVRAVIDGAGLLPRPG